MPGRFLRLLFAWFLALGIICAPVLHAQYIPAEEYRQSEAVKQRYSDPKISFATPGFAPGKNDFTSHDELMEFVYG